WFTDPGIPEQEMELARVHPEVADRVARALAPVRDATAGSATSALPRSAPLLDVLGVERPDPRWVAENWLTRRPYGLAHPLGLGIDGPVTVDLVSDGPHALIGGTSGAGKSELLQSVVASLAATYPPSRVNFLFVDYKGGASSTVFRDLPHTVGCVTNLDGELALRALTSLRAELNRRMKLLEGRAKDLAEMLERHPEEAPPSLVIVVDEFATLVEEIPDFVAGMVDIAQRGRSLGIHLVLATQRPSGAVNDNILANTNLRVALRMLDPSDSSAVIGSQVAAEIPVPLSGRAYARLGPREVVAFQAAHASAPLAADRSDARVLVEAFPAEEQELASLAAATGRVGASGVTHLDALLDAVRVAARQLDLPLPRAPWCDVLPQHLTLAAVLEARPPGPASPGRSVTLGMVDDPEGQCQYPATVDLEEGGGLVVYGSGGSGRTTTLRTAAASAASDGGPEEVVIFGLDFASRSLRSITSLPHVAAVATGDDLEAVTRVIALLDAELDRRRQLLAEAIAENLSAFLARGGDLARILVLVDGYPSLAAALTGGGYASPLDRWLDAFHGVVLHGRQVGIHTILTADRRASVPALLQAGLANRIVLRQADENAYADHGVGSIRARGLDLAPGRGLWQARQVVQIACVSERADAAAQA
ncbi:MAG: FtsK/SpoIIIE domain-containing protein, partial [Acidimicrobiia bacterium]